MSKIFYASNKSEINKDQSMGTYSIESSANFVDSNELIIEVTRPSPSKNDLNTFTKFCFAAAGLPFQMYFCVIGIFMTVFLLEKAKLPPEKSTYILFISRIMDAITDPIYGYFVNNSKFTKYGKMKPWIIVSTPLSIISYIIMWYVPPDWSEDSIFYWFIFWHSLFFTVVTGVRIPHTSMTMYLSKNQDDRQSATIYRMGFELIGILLALGIQGPFVINNNQCKNSTNVTILPIEPSNEVEKSLFGNQVYAILAIFMSIFFAVGNLLLIIFVKEKNDIDSNIGNSDYLNKTQKNPSTLTELKRMFTYRSFVILLISFVFNQLTIQILQANLQLYFEYGFYAIKKLFVITILILLSLAILFIPLWQFLMNKVGKKISLILGNSLLIPLMVSSLFFRNPTLVEIIPFFVFLVIAANSFTASFLVPWAMLPECFDEYFLKFKSRPDALFYTFFVLGVKILMAFYLGLSQVVLSLVGFQNGVCPEYQNKSVSDAIIYLYAPIPLAFSIISSLATLMYPINEAKAKENTALISKMNDDEKANRVNSILSDPTRGEVIKI